MDRGARPQTPALKRPLHVETWTMVRFLTFVTPEEKQMLTKKNGTPIGQRLNFPLHPWPTMDMAGLIYRLPDIHEGASKWVQAFEERNSGSFDCYWRYKSPPGKKVWKRSHGGNLEKHVSGACRGHSSTWQ